MRGLGLGIRTLRLYSWSHTLRLRYESFTYEKGHILISLDKLNSKINRTDEFYELLIDLIFEHKIRMHKSVLTYVKENQFIC